QTLSLEDIAVDTLVHSSCGTVVMPLFQGFFPAPSWHTFTLLARGWALATDRHPITTYVWLTGATTVKHFSRVSLFLGCPLSQHPHRLRTLSQSSASPDTPRAVSVPSSTGPHDPRLRGGAGARTAHPASGGRGRCHQG